MTTPILMPQLGVDITEAQIDAWLKAVGDRVEKGAPLVLITTPKLSFELEAPVGGRLAAITVGADEIAEVGAILGEIDEAG